jgi:hypothetical protein
MTTSISDAIRIVAHRFGASADASELRRLAIMVQRLELTLDEIAADAMEDATSPRTGNVIEFRRRG